MPSQNPEESNCSAVPHKALTPDTIVKAAIYPPIGVCRVGDSHDEYFIGPEVPTPIEQKLGFYRDATGKLKRQAARFRIYGLNAEGKAVKELTSNNAEIKWSLHLANQKSAWYQFQLALDIPEAADAPPTTLRNPTISDRSKLTVDAGKVSIAGANNSSGPLEGAFMEKSVYLGEAHTDGEARLTVLGGRGVSASYNGSLAVTFANNETWHDDTADGPVTAKVILEGVELIVDPAWVIVAPPDYAPMQKSVRTMWDLMRDVAIQAKTLAAPKIPSFTAEIQPIFERLTNLQWVNAGFAAAFGWKGPFDFSDPQWLARLADKTPANRGLRTSLYNQFRNYEFDGWSPKPWPYLYGDAMNVPAAKTPRQNTELSATQLQFLKKWAKGNFISDYNPAPKHPTDIGDYTVEEQPEILTQAAMEFCLADAFHPGCEMTWPMRHSSMYSSPFRLKHADLAYPQPQFGGQLNSSALSLAYGPLGGQYAGDITRWMAVPWQTDTASCRSGYDKSYDPYVPTFWPARVPNQIMSKEQYGVLKDPNSTSQQKLDAFADRPSWNTPLDLKKGYTHQINAMINGFSQMGVVEVRDLSQGTDFPSNVQVADRNEIIDYKEKTTIGLHAETSPDHEERDHDLSTIEKVQRFQK